MACNKCRRRKCNCGKASVVADTPEVVKVNTIPVPGEQGDPGPEGDTYVPIFDDNFFDI